MSRCSVFALLLSLPAAALADTINWGSEFGSINVQSDGTTPVTSGFTIQLGKFAAGFQPDGQNVDLWASNWIVFDELLPGEHNAAVGYYTSEHQLLNNTTFQPGDRAYVWMYNSQTAVPGSEWLLYTNDPSDGLTNDDWLFPSVPGSQQTTPLSWRVSNSSRVVFGATDPDGDGPGQRRYGNGWGTPPAEGFHVQTRTFVPEPGAAVLGGMAALFLLRRRRAAASLLAAATLTGAASAQVVPTRFAYCVADSGDTLVRMNRFDGSEFSVIGDLGTSNVECMSWNLRGDVLYAINADDFGTVNYETGAFTVISADVGTANGSLGSININDVDGLAADPTNGDLYATVRREATGTDLDLLIRIDPVTGLFIANAFGAGLDYLPIATNTIATTPLLYDVDDIGIDPVSGRMYGVVNNSGGNDHLVLINKTTGAVTLVGVLRLADNTPVTDMEGYSYFNDGTFYGTTGNNSVNTAHRDRLWTIDKATGICTLVGPFGSGADYEAVGVLHAGYNTITGTVFGDVNRSGVLDAGDYTQSGVTVRLYRDVNGDGHWDVGDILFNTLVTDGSGFYSFETASIGDFITVVDVATLPAGMSLTTTGVHTASFTDWFNVDASNDFGFTGDAAVGDVIWQDLDGNGVQDAGEPAIPDVTVYLDLDNNGVRDATEPLEVTDGAGFYLVSELIPGTYHVRVDTATLPAGMAQTGDPDSTINHHTTVTLAAAETRLTADFGYRGTAVVTGHLYYDVNGDGDQDPGEPDLQNISVVITDVDGVDQAVSTNSSGDWTVNVKPGATSADVFEADPDFALQVPAGWAQMEGEDPTNVTAVADTTTFAGNDGYFTPGGVCGRVLLEEDGIAGGGGPPSYAGIENVELTLVDTNGNPVDADPEAPGPQPVTTFTDSNGDYCFTGLPPGTYGILETHPSGYISVSDTDGGNPDEIRPVIVTAGQDITGNDFIEEIPVGIGSLIFADLNANGFRDAGEGGVSVPVQVQLYHDSNDDGDLDDPGENLPVQTVFAIGGNYSFTNLPRGNYQVVIPVPPSGYALSSPGADTLDNGEDNDDNGSQAGIGAATSSPLISLRPGTEPDVAVDGTGPDIDSTVDFAFTPPKPNNWLAWQNLNPLGGQNGPDQNPDGDLTPNLIEFAFCYDPRNGVPKNPNGRRGYCLLQNAQGGFDVEVIRPAGLVSISYTLEYTDALGTPTAWSANDDLSDITPVISPLSGGFERVLWQNVDTLPALSGPRGFTRIRVEELDLELTAYTEVQGWLDHTIASQCETYSNPFVRKELFSGTADAGSPQDAINVAGSAAGADIANVMAGGQCLYVEVLAGALEGHRFAVNAAASDADTIALLPGHGMNTATPIPDLSGAPFVLREAWMFSDLFPAGTFQSGGDLNTADNLLAFNPATQTWTTCFLANLGAFGTYWVDSADTSGPPPVNQDTRCIDPCEGLYVHRRGPAITVPLYGIVRENDFRCPLTTGHNLIGGGYPMDQSYASRGMTLAAGFDGDTDILAADQVLLWAGDTAVGHVCYNSFYLLDAGAPYQRWVSAADNFVTALDSTPAFKAARAAFIKRTAGLGGYKVTAPWTP